MEVSPGRGHRYSPYGILKASVRCPESSGAKFGVVCRRPRDLASGPVRSSVARRAASTWSGSSEIAGGSDVGDAGDATFTFGVEVEILVTAPVERYIQCLPGHLRQPCASKRAAKALSLFSENGGYEHFVREDMARTLRGGGIDVGEVDKRQDAFDKWSVGIDVSISAEHGQHREMDGEVVMIGVELRTPAFVFEEAAFGEIARAVALLKRRFTVGVNETCALHVHVGLCEGTPPTASPSLLRCDGVYSPASRKGMQKERGRQTRFDVVATQNIAALALAFEPQFRQLHGRSRLESSFCKPLQKAFLAGGALCDRRTTKRLLDQTFAARDLKDLLDMLGRHGVNDVHYAINLQNLRDDSGLGTIEFRRHEGSFDPEQIEKRVRLCVGVVRWACGERTSQETRSMRDSLRREAGNGHLTLGEVLRLVGIEESVVRYYLCGTLC